MNLLVRAFHAGAPSKIHAVKSLLGTCANLVERLSPEYLLFALDGGHVERTRLFPDYKAHRPPKAPELVAQIELAEEVLAAIGWPTIRVTGWEADDIVASLVKQLAGRAASIVVASSDKDLLQLVGPARIYHPWDQGSHLSAAHVVEKFGVRPDQVGDYLALCGDKSDGVPGVNGIGDKKARELLAAYGNLDAILQAAYYQQIAGAAGKHLREQAEAARMSRQLVELRADIPVPHDWIDWPAASPRAGWINELRRLDLGASVQRLSQVLPANGRVRSGSPAIVIDWQPESPESLESGETIEPVPHVESVPGDHRVDTAIPAAQPCSERRPEPARCHETPCEHPTFTSSGDLNPALLESHGLRAYYMPVPSTADPDWIWHCPPWGRVPASAGREARCRAVYAWAVRERVESRRRPELLLDPPDPPSNPWREGLDVYEAWRQGREGLPYVYVPGTLTIPSPPASIQSTPSASPQRTLF